MMSGPDLPISQCLVFARHSRRYLLLPQYALVCGIFLGKRVYVLSDELFLSRDAVVKSFP